MSIQRTTGWKAGSALLAAFLAFFLMAGLANNAQAQIQWAGTHYVDLDATRDFTPGTPVTQFANAAGTAGTFDSFTPGGIAVAADNPTGTAPINVLVMPGTDLLKATTGLPAALAGGAKSFSLEFWYSNPDVSGAREYIFGTNGAFTAPYVYFVSSTVRALSSGGGVAFVDWQTPPAAGWVHQVFTYDAPTGAWKLYENGRVDREGIGTAVFDIGAAGAPLTIGGYFSDVAGTTLNPSLSGSLSVARIHGDALSTSQVRSNFNTECPKYLVSSAPEFMDAATTITGAAEANLSFKPALKAVAYPLPAFALVGAPAGMTIDASSGMITWSPSGVAGIYSFTVEASNTVGTNQLAVNLVLQPQVPAGVVNGDVFSINADFLANGPVTSWGNLLLATAGSMLPSGAIAQRSTFVTVSGSSTGQVAFTGSTPATAYYWSNQPLPATVTDGSWTVEAWVKPTAAFNGTWTSIVALGNGSGPAEFAELCGQSNSWGMRTAAGTWVFPAPGDYLNKWHHLVGTYNGTTLKFYADGALAGQKDEAVVIADATHATGSRLRMSGMAWNGNGSPDGWNMFAGNYARVRLHSAALTDANILGNYTAELPQFQAAPIPELQVMVPVIGTVNAGAVATGATGEAIDVIFRNAAVAGGLPMTINSITVTGEYAVEVADASPVFAGASRTVKVYFKPVTAGPQTGVLTINTDGGAPATITFRGNVARWYVNSATGADGNDGRTSATAKATMANAYNSAANGDLIEVAPGAYANFDMFTAKSLRWEAPAGGAIVTGYPLHFVGGRMSFDKFTFNSGPTGGGYGGVIYSYAQASELDFTGCTFSVDGASGAAGTVGAGGDSIKRLTFDGCTFSGGIAKTGVNAFTTFESPFHLLRVTNSSFDGLGTCIQDAFVGGTLDIRGNTFTNVAVRAINNPGPSKNITIRGNRMSASAAFTGDRMVDARAGGSSSLVYDGNYTYTTSNYAVRLVGYPAVVVNNVAECDGNLAGGAFTMAIGTGLFANNTVIAVNAGTGVGIDAATGDAFNNVVLGFSTPFANTSPASGSNFVDAGGDPQFTGASPWAKPAAPLGAFAYRIGPASPLAGAGVATVGAENDYDGLVRPTPPSKGAFDLHGTLEAVPGTPVDLGSRRTDAGPSAAQSIALTHAAGSLSPVAVQSATITGPDAAAFAAVIVGSPIALGASGSVDVTFDPSTPGPKSATLTILSSATNGPIAVPLTGVGIPSEMLYAMGTDLGLVNFGVVVVNTTKTASLTLENRGDAGSTLTVTAAPVVTPPFSALSWKRNTVAVAAWPVALGIGDKLVAVLEFAPVTAATFDGTVSLELTTLGTKTVALRGRAASGPVANLALTPAAIDFGTVLNFAASAVTTATIVNDGVDATTLSLTGVATDNPAFEIVGISYNGSATTATLPLLLTAPNDKVEVLVRFAPRLPGVDQGLLQAASTDGNASSALAGRNDAGAAAAGREWMLFD